MGGNKAGGLTCGEDGLWLYVYLYSSSEYEWMDGWCISRVDGGILSVWYLEMRKGSYCTDWLLYFFLSGN